MLANYYKPLAKDYKQPFLFAGGFLPMHFEVMPKKDFWNQIIFPLGAFFLLGLPVAPPECTLRRMPNNFPGISSFSLWRLPFRWGLSATVHLEANVCQSRPKMRLACWQGEAKTIVIKTIFHQSEVCPRRIKTIVSKKYFQNNSQESESCCE